MGIALQDIVTGKIKGITGGYVSDHDTPYLPPDLTGTKKAR